MNERDILIDDQPEQHEQQEQEQILPEKVKISLLKNEELNQGSQKLTEEEMKIINLNKNYLESKLWTWKKDQNFLFTLPKTIFTKKEIIESDADLRYQDQIIHYENPEIIGHHFSHEILDQIWKKGEFEIKSTEPDLPYKWKLSKLTVKGIENVKYRYRKDMSISFLFLYSLYYRFSTYNYKKIFPLSFPSSIYYLYYSIYQIIHLFFGLPLYHYDDYKISKKIYYQRLQDFIRLNGDLDFTFFDPKNIQILRKFDSEFKSKWISEIKPRLIKDYKQQKLSKDVMTTNLHEEQIKEFLKFLTENNKFDEFEKLHPCTKDYLLSQQIVNNATFYYLLEKEQKINNYKKELQKNYIRDLCNLWHSDKMEEYSDKIMKEVSDGKENKIKREIQDKKDPSSIYNYNTNNKKEVPDLIKKQLKLEKEPYNKYEVMRFCTKPYERYQSETEYGIRYHLKKVHYYEIKTSFCFWRVILFMIKFFCALINFNIVIYRQMIDSMFGIKALCLYELYRDYEIDENNGRVSKSRQTYTFPRSISNLWIWIMESRKDFERAPDTGILGKGCTRIFHLFLNYVIRLLIIGSLLITLYPLSIILNFVICFCLIILSPILVTLWVLLDFLLCIIFYNRYDKLKCLPLLRILLFNFCFSFVMQLIGSILSVILQPILSLFFLIYSHIHFVLRYFYDLFFFTIFKCLGKVPETNNCIAWVIGGPGLFRNRYYDLKNKDILSLVIGELEKRVMANFKKNMERNLDKPANTIINIKKVYNKIGLDYRMSTEMSQSISYYKELLRNQIKERKFYPECHVNVKFTENRISEVKSMVELYITEYSKMHDISFDLDKYEEKKVENLAENILKTIFGINILEPLQSTDKIVHLKSVFKNELDNITTKVFENPMFDDKIAVEDRPAESQEVRLPDFANFESVFRGDLNLDLSYLNYKEKNNLFKDNEEVNLIIKT